MPAPRSPERPRRTLTHGSAGVSLAGSPESLSETPSDTGITLAPQLPPPPAGRPRLTPAPPPPVPPSPRPPPPPPPGPPASRQHRSPPPEQPARQSAGVLAAVDHHRAIDDHRPDARRILVRVVVGRPIDDRCGVEHDHVGRLAFRQEAAVRQAERRRGGPGALEVRPVSGE